MRLFAVELDRFVSRPALRWIAVAVLFLAASAALLALGPATPISESARAQAVADFEEYHAMWLTDHEAEYESCLEAEASERETFPEADWECEYVLEEPKLSDWLWETSFADTGIELVRGVTLGLLFLVLMGAITFIAAEFSTGAIGNWLTFEPRRVRVYLSKLGAAVTVSVFLSALGYSVAVAAAYLPFAILGTTGTVPAQLWADLAAGGGRFALAGGLVAVIGVALAFLLRHLAAAIGVAFGWLVIVEQLVAAAVPTLQRWTVSLNLTALQQGSASYYLDVCSTDDGGRPVCEWTEFTISQLHGGLVVGGIAVVLTLAALLVFRRRDLS